MATNFFKVKKGLNLDATTAASTASAEGDVNWDATNHKLEYHDGTAVRKTVSENATQTLTNKTLSGNTATNLISGSGTLTLNTSGTMTLPNATDTVVGKATTDTLTNKILSGNTATNLISGSGTLTVNTTGTITIPNATDTLVGKATTDVLTNKTLNGNTATNLISGSGTFTLNTTGTITAPNGTDTLVGKATTDVLTNKTLTTPVIASLTSGAGTFTHNTSGTITVPNGTDTLVGKATTDVLTNKTLTSPVVNTPSITTATFTDSPILTQIATPSTPSSGFNKIYPKSDGYFYSLDPSGSERKIGAGAGAINYILNPDAEGSTTGWATYADAAGTSPVDGTGGSPTTTWTRTTSSPLRGAGSFLLTKDAANRQGEGASYAFTIDSADQAKPIAVSFDYTVGSGTYADGDLTVWLYDVTNSLVIQPAPSSILSVVAGTSQKWSGYFQTSTASTSYRLIVHVTTTSASAYTVKFDNFGVGSTFAAYGAVQTDWTAFTPTGSWVSNTTYSGFYRRRGDSIDLQYQLSLTGAPTSATLTVNLPSGITLDSTKLTAQAANTLFGGVKGVGAGNGFTGSVQYNNTTSLIPVYTKDGSTASIMTLGAITNTAPYTFANADFITIVANDLPVSGWSSNVQVSSDTDTRVCAMHANLTTSTTGISNSTLVCNSVDFDTHGAYNNSTGIYTVPIPGIYRIVAKTLMSALDGATDTSITIDKNGVTQEQTYGSRLGSNPTAQTENCVVALVKCIAGDQLRSTVNGDASFNLDSNGTRTTISVERLSGPSQIAASETVSARYGATATTFTNNSAITITHTSKDHDTHNAYSAGTYTIPTAGKYFVQLAVSTDAFAAGATTNVIQAIIQKNGSDFAYGNNRAFITSSTGHAAYVTTTLSCIAGDTIRLQGFHTLGSTPTLTNTATDNYFSIYKIGN